MDMSEPTEAITNSADQSAPLLVQARQLTEASPVQSQVLSCLRAFLQNGHFSAGSRLPSERALAAQFGVGRPAVREALKTLSVLDILESRRGSGTYVKSLVGLESGWPSQLSRTGIDPNLMELLEARKIIEPKAAALAAARATELQLRAIADARLALENESADESTVPQRDVDFHTTIIVASGNRVLVEVNRSLAPLMLQSRKTTVRIHLDLVKVRSEHYAIFNAIVCGQSAAAEQAMLEHLHTVGLDLISKPRR